MISPVIALPFSQVSAQVDKSINLAVFLRSVSLIISNALWENIRTRL